MNVYNDDGYTPALALFKKFMELLPSLRGDIFARLTRESKLKKKEERRNNENQKLSQTLDVEGNGDFQDEDDEDGASDDDFDEEEKRPPKSSFSIMVRQRPKRVGGVSKEEPEFIGLINGQGCLREPSHQKKMLSRASMQFQ